MQTYDIIFVIATVIVFLAFCVVWYLRMRDMDRTLYPLKSDSKSIISHALHQMNIKVEWEKEGDNQIVHYTYQGGHFNITLEKNSPFARLTFLFFYQTDIDNIETVRVVCNLCNLNTDACRIVYTIDEKKGKVDIHLISVLPVHNNGMKDMLERVMGDAFRWQNTFTTKYEHNKDDDEKAGTDKEKAKAQLTRDLQLLREQEMTHQEAGPDWHETKDNEFTMSGLLASALGLTDIIPIRMTLTIDGNVSTIEDPDEILSYKISEPLIGDKNFIHDSATGKLDFYDPRDPVTTRNLMLDFEQQGKTKDTLFYRITLALVPVALNEKKISIESEQHRKQMTSVLLGYELNDPKERLAHFRYIWKEAMAKQKAGSTDKMTDEEKVLANIQDPHLGYNYYHGRNLYLHKRFYEALQPLTDAYRTVTHIYDHHDRHVMDLLDEIAYFIGCCYMGLHQYDRAAYYLQLTIPTTHQSYTEAYVNCLVNSDDFRAMDVLTGLQGTLQTMLNNLDNQDEDDDEDESMQESPSHEQLVNFLNFVKRRRAYMLVNKGKYNEAEPLLKQLLDDPNNSDFALSELAYIQKNK